jgi:hypothetical protein
MNKSVNLWLKVKDKEIDELVSIIQQGCVILAGAGISYNCFPLASDLKHLIAKTLIDNAVGIKKNEYKTFMSKHPWNDFPLETVLAWINDIIGQGALDAILAVFKNGRPSFYHKLFALCLKKKYFHSIFTTNFDELLEQACNELKVKFDRYISGSYRKNIHNGPMIVKLHGTISQPMTILAVLKEIYRSRNSHAIQYLRNLVSKKHLIVVGYSGYDLIDIMPTLMLSDIYKCFWLIHVPEGEKV